MKTLQLLSLLSLLAPTLLSAQRPPTPQWGGLDPGPYRVGVRVISTWDHSRTWWSPVDWRGVERPAAARPMQIILWYPVGQGNTGAGRVMPFGEYLDLWAGELGDTPIRSGPPRSASTAGGRSHRPFPGECPTRYGPGSS